MQISTGTDKAARVNPRAKNMSGIIWKNKERDYNAANELLESDFF